MDGNKLEAALRACMQVVERSPRPVSEVGLFLDALVSNPDWSSDEIMELQMLIIQGIVHRWRGPDGR